MTEPYLLPDGPKALHDLILHKDDSLLSISTNRRTLHLSHEGAEQLLLGLMALLRGPFTEALTETSLLLRAERSSPPRPTSAPFQPNLGDL